MVPRLSHQLPLLAVAILRLHSARAYTWSYQEAPTQCGDITVSIAGSNDGTPPFRILIVPAGPSPLANNVDPRQIMDIPFPDSQLQVQFQLPYPADSQFVAVVSDATGFGSGGTSVATTVQPSSNSSCFDPTSSATHDFYFAIEPPNQLVQCQDMRIWWDPTIAEGIPNFLGVIPGGQSFTIPQPANTTIPSQGTGFTWTPSLRGGTTLILIGGDARGNGTAGRTQNVVSFGTNDITSCLSDNSPSSTPGSPAGTYPTSSASSTSVAATTSTAAGDAHSSSRSPIAAIVGGVAGALAILIIVALILYSRRRRGGAQGQHKGRPAVDLTRDDYDPRAGTIIHNELLYHRQADPLLMSTLTLGSGSQTGREDKHLRRTSVPSTRAAAPDTEYSVAERGMGTAKLGEKTRKEETLRSARVVNYVQHDDAGPSDYPLEQERETVELPPAYAALRRPEAGEGSADLASRRRTLDKRQWGMR